MIFVVCLASSEQLLLFFLLHYQIFERRHFNIINKFLIISISVVIFYCYYEFNICVWREGYVQERVEL